jgi:hypothetical protein
MDRFRAMYARAVEEAASRLRELRSEERGDLTLAALAMALALGATQLSPELAMPLFLGGVGVGALGVRALWRRWDLLDRLSSEPDAYVISDVLAFASREATMGRRRARAASMRHWLSTPHDRRLGPVVHDLAALAEELEDERLEFDPVCAVDCARLLNDGIDSPLLNPGSPAGELEARIRRIRSGFQSRELAA